MQELDFDEVLDQIVRRDARYHRDAYCFVREALDYTQKKVARKKESESRQKESDIRHVTGQELLDGIRDFALEQFGPMSLTLLNEWGVQRCEDFGEIVFNLVESKILAKTDKDSRLDFQCGYDFEDAFRNPYLPASGRHAGQTIRKSKTPA
ncbi:MAG TPA: Minf_1886 family protein [Methylomirabilota bacterium]|nr:Minf_1886 family protein [Methylomirabilota bacterium]